MNEIRVVPLLNIHKMPQPFRWAFIHELIHKEFKEKYRILIAAKASVTIRSYWIRFFCWLHEGYSLFFNFSYLPSVGFCDMRNASFLEQGLCHLICHLFSYLSNFDIRQGYYIISSDLQIRNSQIYELLRNFLVSFIKGRGGNRHLLSNLHKD